MNIIYTVYLESDNIHVHWYDIRAYVHNMKKPKKTQKPQNPPPKPQKPQKPIRGERGVMGTF